MPTTPFRFIHSGDFHLEQPLMGVADVPNHLRDLFLDAPYDAARRVFEAAIAEDATFVVLSGDVVHPAKTGPRGPLFLVEQFARLAARNIGVYWAGGPADPPEAWPIVIRLPENVHLFPQGHVEEVLVTGKDGPLARLAGVGRSPQRAWRPGDFHADPGGSYTVAIAHGEAEPAAMQSRGIDYWALGGRHDRCTPQNGPGTIHYSGSPQGRWPREQGIHGCTLVQVDAQRQTHTSLIPTDAVRWIDGRLSIDELKTAEDLQSQLQSQMDAMLAAAAERVLLISWTLAGGGPLWKALRRGTLAADTLQWLRGEYGYRSPAAWAVSLHVELPETLPPPWYEQETIRGDFLRAIRQLQMNPGEPLVFDSYLAEPHRAGTLAAAVGLADNLARDAVLCEAAALGVDLLSGEDQS